MKTYYHLIEEKNGELLNHGYFTKKTEAQNKVDELYNTFLGGVFYWIASNSKFITLNLIK